MPLGVAKGYGEGVPPPFLRGLMALPPSQTHHLRLWGSLMTFLSPGILFPLRWLQMR